MLFLFLLLIVMTRCSDIYMHKHTQMYTHVHFQSRVRRVFQEHSKIFRRFIQKLARKILARWIRQANVSKSLAESSCEALGVRSVVHM